jgi:hypothetical protein
MEPEKIVLLGKHILNGANNRRITISVITEEDDDC